MSAPGWVGLALFALGLGYRWRPLARLDVTLFRHGHRALRSTAWLWRSLWPLGTTVFTLIALLLLATRNFVGASHAALVYLALALFEPALKRLIRRPRPFTYLGGVIMSQPRRPRDASFPSGDALRVWFLALLLPTALGGGAIAWGVALALATLVSLGRVALGVHHPLDVLAGAGLGLLGFAVWMML